MFRRYQINVRPLNLLRVVGEDMNPHFQLLFFFAFQIHEIVGSQTEIKKIISLAKHTHEF
jgi:hypothetical protein